MSPPPSGRASRAGRDPDDGGIEGDAPGRPEEGSVAVVEDAAIGGHLPVAESVGAAGHADDRLVDGDAAGGAEEPGVTEAEDAAVRGHLPVATAAGRRGQSDHRLVERL